MCPLNRFGNAKGARVAMLGMLDIRLGTTLYHIGVIRSCCLVLHTFGVFSVDTYVESTRGVLSGFLCITRRVWFPYLVILTKIGLF